MDLLHGFYFFVSVILFQLHTHQVSACQSKHCMDIPLHQPTICNSKDDNITDMSFSSPPPAKKAKTDDASEHTNKLPFLSPSTQSSPSKSVTESEDSTRCIIAASTSASQEDRIRRLLLTEANYDIDNPNNTKKRQDYLNWDDYFMAVSFLSAQRSKDPHEQFGACIVDDENRIVGIGYNGFPRGCSDDMLPWASNSQDSEVDYLHTKDPFMCQAEINAILNKCSADVKGTRMYVAGIPDNVAAKLIIQAGITEIVYVTDPIDNDATRASRIMFHMAGVKLRKYNAKDKVAPLDFRALSQLKDVSQDGPATLSQDTSLSSAVSTNDDYDEEHLQLLVKEAKFNPKHAKIRKREEYLSWDDYFTAVAYLSARRSKDPNTQVGACIVDANKCIIGIGYNGFPRGCSDDHLPWARKGNSELHKKYHYVVHAEVNAVLNKGSKDVKGASLYVALFPCCDCAKVIIQSGIREVVYLSDQVRGK